jgi:DNA-binding transcriptional LysR family regulator
MGMDIELLRMFQVVCDEGSLTRAAARLFRTQPAITQQIQLLEREFGHVLLERSARGVRPTAQGQALRDRAGRLFREWEGLQEEMRDLAQGVHGELRIACSDTVARYFLPAILEEFVRSHPKVRLELRHASSGEIARMVEDGVSEVGFVLLPLARTGLEVRPVLGYRHRAAYGPQSLLAELGAVAARELVKERLVLLPRETRTRQHIEEGFVRQGLVCDEVLEVGNVSVQKAMVRAGLGVGILPDYAFTDGDGLQSRPIEDSHVRTIAVCTAKGFKPSGAAQAFLALLPASKKD